ncbi:MAG TPA: hypothetical protein VF622_01450 [Segetibacter sp.]
MKNRNIILLLLIAMPLMLLAQTNSCVIKTYGYSRTILSGVAPTEEIEIGGKVVKSDEPRNNKEYYIYLTTCYTTSVTIISVWINGNNYSAKAVKAKAPVIINNTTHPTKGMKETLVSKTSSPVWELRLAPDNTMLKPTTTMKKLMGTNALVITGIVKGKKFTSVLKNLKELQPIALQ